MKTDKKAIQVATRFDQEAFARLKELAHIEHRGLGEFVRHATLYYIDHYSIDIVDEPLLRANREKNTFAKNRYSLNARYS